MFKARLIGLMLFVTAILLALVAAATKTSHVTIGEGWPIPPHTEGPASAWNHSPSSQAASGAGMDSPAAMPGNPRAVLILWPLLALAAAGLALWFIQPAASHKRPLAKSRAKRRR